MIEDFKGLVNQDVSVELLNGEIIVGRILDVTNNYIHQQSAEGVVTIFFPSVAVIWENENHSVTQEDMEYMANQMRKCTKDYGPTPI